MGVSIVVAGLAICMFRETRLLSLVISVIVGGILRVMAVGVSAAVLNGGPDLVAGAPNGLCTLVQDYMLWVRFYNLSWKLWHPSILASDIGIPLRIDNSTITRNYGHFSRVLVDMDLVGFVPEKLLLETMDNYIEVELYFESLSDLCSSCHSVGHSVVKYKSVIEKTPPKVGSHGKEKENKALDLTQVYKQESSIHVESTTPTVPTTNAFEVLNIEVTPTHIDETVHQHDAVPPSRADKNTEIGIKVQPSASNLGTTPNKTDFNTEVGKSVRNSKNVRTPSHYSTVPHQVISWVDAFGDSDNEIDDYKDDRFKDELPALQSEGSSQPSKEIIPNAGQQSNAMAIVPIPNDSSCTISAVQWNLDLAASQPSVSKFITIPSLAEAFGIKSSTPGYPRMRN
ncbi:hypothetical protein FNV43_RR24741 [Rhamnella rubrinervis]|uniref:Uncharacterized protein n=1 Tax=Rhamnella rubrinervis TaxID=2594499 RepID=A0A8K0DT00_9ROSA|nr:hypothetical protein FNV43_RR24741 [Rhamnella rubrinervis]